MIRIPHQLWGILSVLTSTFTSTISGGVVKSYL